MSAEPIISVSGLRGIVGVSLTPDLTARYVAAFAAECPPGPIVLTRDGRTTGPMIAQAVRSALMACGRDVLDADVAATPTTGVLVSANRAAGGGSVHVEPVAGGPWQAGAAGADVEEIRGGGLRRLRDPRRQGDTIRGRVAPGPDGHAGLPAAAAHPLNAAASNSAGKSSRE